MRLDHLLSKEHLDRSSVYSEAYGSRATIETNVLEWLAHGWNIDIVTRIEPGNSVHRLRPGGTVAGGEPGLLHAVGS